MKITLTRLLAAAEASPRHRVWYGTDKCFAVITRGEAGASVTLYIEGGTRFRGAHHTRMRPDSPDKMTLTEAAAYVGLSLTTITGGTMPTMIEATANENGYFPRGTFDHISDLAHGIPWHHSESGEDVNATTTVTFEDSSVVSGEILFIESAHVGSFRDPAEVWILTDGSRLLLLNRRIEVRETVGDHIRIKRAAHVAVAVVE